MAQCFCGCGQKVSFGLRAINKRGKIIHGDITQVHALLAAGMQSPNAEMFVHDGQVLCNVLAEAVHTATDPGREVEQESRGFMAFARQNFGTSAFGKRIRNSGMDTPAAIAAITSGAYDPFEDVSIPLR